ncbi:Hypothetical predicted protein [Pelobates cultripes]|uniref:Uncharacterized protein n=1 Tax=Pelobates cultripes TaxID=61616 RepID=A0AAD1WNH3_PELCU|nr:Hypothetical predicted protein [Pelobates cultripes]
MQLANERTPALWNRAGAEKKRGKDRPANCNGRSAERPLLRMRERALDSERSRRETAAAATEERRTGNKLPGKVWEGVTAAGGGGEGNPNEQNVYLPKADRRRLSEPAK